MSDLERYPINPIPLSLDDWPRRDHFVLYSSFQEPFFSITANVECGGLVESCKQQGASPTLRIWHSVLRAVNQIPAFALRIHNGQPVRHETIHLSSTVLRPDETFAIIFLPFLSDFAEFEADARERIERAKLTTGLKLDVISSRQDLIHFSTLPWFRFTGLTHARALGIPDSAPKITLGKYAKENGQWLLPVSVTVHHGLVDGLHVARYLKALEEILNAPLTL